MCRRIFSILFLFEIAAFVDAAPVEITVRDKKSGQPAPCRIHLKDSAGKPQRAPGLPFWFDHFVCAGTVKLELEPGKYTIEIERGPEHARVKSLLVIGDKPAKFSFQLERLLDLGSEGWWSGDLHVHRLVSDIELLMRAEELHIAPVITWWN